MVTRGKDCALLTRLGDEITLMSYKQLVCVSDLHPDSGSLFNFPPSGGNIIKIIA